MYYILVFISLLILFVKNGDSIVRKEETEEKESVEKEELVEEDLVEKEESVEKEELVVMEEVVVNEELFKPETDEPIEEVFPNIFLNIFFHLCKLKVTILQLAFLVYNFT